MNDKNHATKNVTGRWLEIDEVRLVNDLRIMHAKVDELNLLVQNLKRRHDEADLQLCRPSAPSGRHRPRGPDLSLVCGSERRRSEKACLKNSASRACLRCVLPALRCSFFATPCFCRGRVFCFFAIPYAPPLGSRANNSTVDQLQWRWSPQRSRGEDAYPSRSCRQWNQLPARRSR